MVTAWTLTSEMCRFQLVRVIKPWAALALLAGGVLSAAPAWADLWGYVDERGVPHFSAARLDDRYELFLRAADEPVTAGPIAAAGVDNAAARATPGGQPPRLMAYLEALPAYHATQPLLREAAQATGVDAQLLKAVIAAESGFDPRAISPKGAIGLMQLIVPTAQRYGVRADRSSPVQAKLMDPKTNIQAGARYLRDLMAMFPGQLELSLAAYNAGEGAVQRAGNQIPNYPETQNYVRTVMQLYRHWQPHSAAALARNPAHAQAPSVAPTSAAPVARMGGAVGRGNMLPSSESRPLLGPLPGLAAAPR